MNVDATQLEGTRLAMPAHVFVEAVKLASAPRTPIEGFVAGFVDLPGEAQGLRGAAVQARYAAVDHITAWWNATAPESVRGAVSFMPYVKVQAGEETWWASGAIEEGYVSDAEFQAGSTRGHALVLERVVLIFVRAPVVDPAWWFSAASVDGGHGVEGGLPDGLSAHELVATDAYDALHEFPSRFDALWSELQRAGDAS
jgi:hypothetical protein